MKKNLLSIAATLSLGLALTSCGGGQTPAPVPVLPPVSDTTSPSVVSVTPVSGAIGVSKDASVVVTFSEPMNQASAHTAFQSANLGASTFSWNADGTTLTVNPNLDLEYSSSGKTYDYSVTTTATDKVGNALGSTFAGNFKTFKRVTASLTATAFGEIDNAQTVLSTSADIKVGDQTNNSSRRGFVGFDLSSLPATLAPANLEVARVKMYVNSPIVGSPFSKLFPPTTCTPFCILVGKSVMLEHIYFGNSVAPSAYGINPLSNEVRGLTDDTPCTGPLLCLFQGTSTGWNSDNVLEWVRDDLTERSSRANKSQLRIRFPKDTNADNLADYIAISTNSKPYLSVTYLIP